MVGRGCIIDGNDGAMQARCRQVEDILGMGQTKALALFTPHFTLCDFDTTTQ
jgi:hypothetical protein